MAKKRANQPPPSKAFHEALKLFPIRQLPTGTLRLAKAGKWEKGWPDQARCIDVAEQLLAEMSAVETYIESGDITMAAVSGFQLGRLYQHLAMVLPMIPQARAVTERNRNLDSGRQIRMEKAAAKRTTLREEALQAVAAAEAELRAEGKPPEHIREAVLNRARKRIINPQTDKPLSLRALQDRLKTS